MSPCLRAAPWFAVAAACSPAPVSVGPPRVSPPVPVAAARAAPAPAPAQTATPAPAPAPPPPPEPEPPGWAYVLPIDQGIRRDRAGRGHFMASRSHGRHNGLDLLAPVGTDVLAACDGHARSGTMGGFGKYVQLVCRVPAALAGQEPLYGSFLFAHLASMDVPPEWTPVARGQVVGKAGKTGNTAHPKVLAHVHTELVMHASEADARAENHWGQKQHDNAAAARLASLLDERCLTPRSFRSKTPIRRQRRFDPFVVLTCLGVPKPTYVPPERIGQGSMPWREQYEADFDVDVGMLAPAGGPGK